MKNIIILSIALTLFATPAFAGDNVFEQRTSMENQVAELAAQPARSTKPLVIAKLRTRLASNHLQKKEILALKKALNFMPYIADK